MDVVCSLAGTGCLHQAVFMHHDPGMEPVFYCYACLPAHLRDRAVAGQLALGPGMVPAPVEESPVKAPDGNLTPVTPA